VRDCLGAKSDTSSVFLIEEESSSEDFLSQSQLESALEIEEQK